jgi:hypothetical protein
MNDKMQPREQGSLLILGLCTLDHGKPTTFAFKVRLPLVG